MKRCVLARRGKKWLVLGIGLFLLVYVSWRFYCELRPTTVFVMSGEATSVEVTAKAAARIGKEGLKVNFEPYESAADRKVSPKGVRAIRRTLAWAAWQPYCPSSLELRSHTNALAMVQSSRDFSLFIELRSEGGKGRIHEVTRALNERIRPTLLDRVMDLLEQVSRLVWSRPGATHFIITGSGTGRILPERLMRRFPSAIVWRVKPARIRSL